LRLVHIYADIAARTEAIHSSAVTALESRSNTAKTVEGAAMPKLDDLGVAEAAKAIRTGETTAEALAEALLTRAAAHASLNAFIAFEPDKVRAAAREADRKRAAGTSAGPLHGVPLALKDNLNTADYPTTGGTPGLAGRSTDLKGVAGIVARSAPSTPAASIAATISSPVADAGPCRWPIQGRPG
jgi:Amidase